MKSKKTYIFKKDGHTGMACGFKPKGVEIVDEILVIYAKEYYHFEKDGIDFGGTVVIKDGDSAENYIEVENKPEEGEPLVIEEEKPEAIDPLTVAE